MCLLPYSPDVLIGVDHNKPLQKTLKCPIETWSVSSLDQDRFPLIILSHKADISLACWGCGVFSDIQTFQSLAMSLQKEMANSPSLFCISAESGNQTA